jgi:hypothetical protein
MIKYPGLLAVIATLLLSAALVRAEQMQSFGDWQVHYVVLASGFLKPEIAASYDVVRGRDHAFVNISVLDAKGQPTKVAMSGHTRNLLGQQQELGFREVAEGGAVYYLADIKHSDEETLRFEIRITPPDTAELRLKFQQKLYWEEP